MISVSVVESISISASDLTVMVSTDLIFRVVPDFAEKIPDCVCKLIFVFAAMSKLPSSDVAKILLRTDMSRVPLICRVSFPPTMTSTSSPCLPFVLLEML